MPIDPEVELRSAVSGFLHSQARGAAAGFHLAAHSVVHPACSGFLSQTTVGYASQGFPLDSHADAILQRRVTRQVTLSVSALQYCCTQCVVPGNCRDDHNVVRLASEASLD